MTKMYYLTNEKLLHQVLKNGININGRDLLPRTYLADNWQWILKMADFFKNLNKSLLNETIIVLELNLTGIQVYPDDMPRDFLPEYWDPSTKDEYSKHCYFTSINIPVSNINKIYSLDGKDLTLNFRTV